MVNWSKSFISFGDVVSKHIALLDFSGMRLVKFLLFILGLLYLKLGFRCLILGPLLIALLINLMLRKVLLSFARCGFLLNLVVVSKLVYSFMVYKWSAMLLKRLNCAICNYFWTGSVSQSKGVTIS